MAESVAGTPTRSNQYRDLPRAHRQTQWSLPVRRCDDLQSLGNCVNASWASASVMTLPTPQQIISAACEEDLAKYGDSFRGVGYTKSPQEAAEHYALMLDVVRETDTALTILDLGCGL